MQDQPSTTDIKQGMLTISLGSILLGGIGVFIRLAGESLPPMVQTFGRIFTAFLVISLFNLVRGTLKTETLHISKKHLPLFALNGLVGFSLLASAFTLSVLKTSITNAYFLLYSAPVFAALFGRLVFKEKLSKSVLISILLGIAGLLIIFKPTSADFNLLGNLFGLLTGISFGAYFVITGYLGKYYSAPTTTFWTQFFGALGIFPLIFIFEKAEIANLKLGAWLLVFGAGVIVFMGYLLLNHGLRKVKASAGSILSLLEPLSAIVYGFIFFAEVPAIYTLCGALLIMLSIVYLARTQTANPS